MLSVIALGYLNLNLVEYCLCTLLKDDVLVFVDSDVLFRQGKLEELSRLLRDNHRRVGKTSSYRYEYTISASRS